MNMKKLVMMALAAVLAVPGFAQIESEPIYTSPNGVATFDMFNHLGFGYNAVQSADYKPAFSSDIFLNVLKVGVYPAEWLGLELGVDLEFNDFSSRESAFALVNDKIQAVDFQVLGLGNTFDRKSSDFSVFSLSAPVLVKGRFGKIQLGAGAVASWNITGTTSAFLRQGNRDLNYSERKAKVNPFSYGIMATVSYGGVGLFCKFYPKSSHLLPEGSVDFSYTTLGIALGL